MKKVFFYIYYRYIEVYRTLFFLYFPNIKVFIFRRTSLINIGNLKTPQQKILIRGKGVIEFKGLCGFGYRLGGFNYGGSIEIQARYSDSKIVFGKNVNTNNNIFICAANYIEIGDDTRIGQNITIMDFEAHGIHPMERNKVGEIGKVLIKKNVWIGNNVIILKNSIIGENSIIAAGAVVSGVFPNNVIIGGVPAKIIKRINE